MKTFVRVIVKIIDGGIKIISEENFLPEFELGEAPSIEQQVIDFLKEEYNLLETLCDPKLLNSKLIGTGTLMFYYTLFYPKDYIDEKNVNKISDIHNKFLDEDASEIRQAIQISPY
jgi:hypothetical protein